MHAQDEADDREETSPAEEASAFSREAAEELLFPSSGTDVDEEPAAPTEVSAEENGPGGEAPPKKRRGRRRRGRGKGQREREAAPRDPAADLAPESADAAESGLAEETESGGNRRRGRRKPAPVSFDEAEAEESVSEATADEVAPAEDDDDEPMEDLNQDWNVPSWSELIASLYRPDR
jgi:ribonuclease E